MVYLAKEKWSTWRWFTTTAETRRVVERRIHLNKKNIK